MVETTVVQLVQQAPYEHDHIVVRMEIRVPRSQFIRFRMLTNGGRMYVTKPRAPRKAPRKRKVGR